MEWSAYRQLCDSPNVFSRWALEQSKTQLNTDLRDAIDAVLLKQHLEKPHGHKGDKRTDMFQLQLPPRAVNEIIECLNHAHELKKQTSGSVIRDYTGLIKAWEEYAAKYSG